MLMAMVWCKDKFSYVADSLLGIAWICSSLFDTMEMLDTLDIDGKYYHNIYCRCFLDYCTIYITCI